MNEERERHETQKARQKDNVMGWQCECHPTWDVGRISNRHTHKQIEAKSNSKQILTSSKTKRNQNTFGTMNNTGIHFYFCHTLNYTILNVELSKNYI